MTEHTTNDAQISDPKLSEIYQSLEKSNPDPSLDKKILDAAFSAVSTQENKQSWLLPLSLAATLVLSVGLTMGYFKTDTNLLETSSPATTADENQKTLHRPEQHALPSETPKPPPVNAPEAGSILMIPESPGLAPAAAPLSGIDTEENGLPNISGSDPYHDFTAADWLTQIQALWRNGDHTHARGAFAEFRRRFPDQPLPVDFPVTESSLLIEP